MTEIVPHTPVLLNEVIEGLDIKSSGIYLDLTLGRGGHSLEIVKRLDTGLLIAFDQDEEAITYSTARLSAYADRCKIVSTNFVNIDEILSKLGIDKVDGILMDLGVSSPQLDESERGFSYRYDAPLDMRMDNHSNPLTAKVIVNTYSLEELTRIFKEYGDEKYAYSIAKNIVKAREKKEILTTFELVDIIKRSKPMKELKKSGHPAKQAFQALRIAVNDELNVLEETIHKALKHLNHNGRLAIITFHSGEDKIVKKIFKEYAVVEGNRYDVPLKPEESEYVLVNRKVITASNEELQINHRAESAKLRIIMRK